MGPHNIHRVPCGEPAEQEPAATWTATSGTLRPGSKRAVRRELSQVKRAQHTSFPPSGNRMLGEWALKVWLPDRQPEGLHTGRNFGGSEEWTDNATLASTALISCSGPLRMTTLKKVHGHQKQSVFTFLHPYRHPPAPPPATVAYVAFLKKLSLRPCYPE